jgi:hypothetical protein
MTSARSAGLRSSYASTSRAALCAPVDSRSPTTSSMATSRVSPRRRPSRPSPARGEPLRTNARATLHPREPCCSMPTSSTVASTSPPSSVRTSTGRSKSSATTSVSFPRCSNRRMLTSPVVMTWPPSTEVTLVIGTKTRRRPATSTTRPMTRGRLRATLNVTTTSRTRPTWSPSGSKTLSSVRRPTKARVGVLTATGYRGGPPGPRITARGCCGVLPRALASATAATVRWSPRRVAPRSLRSRRGRRPDPRRAVRAG